MHTAALCGGEEVCWLTLVALGTGRERSQKGSKVSELLLHLRHTNVLWSCPMNRSVCRRGGEGRGGGGTGEGRGGGGRGEGRRGGGRGEWRGGGGRGGGGRGEGRRGGGEGRGRRGEVIKWNKVCKIKDTVVLKYQVPLQEVNGI